MKKKFLNSEQHFKWFCLQIAICQKCGTLYRKKSFFALLEKFEIRSKDQHILSQIMLWVFANN